MTHAPAAAERNTRSAVDVEAIDPVALIRPCRKIQGISAILLPFQANGDPDWTGFAAHVCRTVNAGLVPAVNMDTGYGNLIDDATRLKALELTRSETDNFVAGAFVGDEPGATFDPDEYLRQMEILQSKGGTPVIFQSFALLLQAGQATIRDQLEAQADLVSAQNSVTRAMVNYHTARWNLLKNLGILDVENGKFWLNDLAGPAGDGPLGGNGALLEVVSPASVFGEE